MKPTFALDLTSEAIALLHRTPKGWLSIGEVAFDAPDMPEALDYLRKTALGLSPLGVATKLILPNSQILYTEVHAPGPSREEKRRQIATALEGRTPYAVEDLVFDWSGKGATVKVAVIARETLDQAEAFAVEHRLNPVSFVAVPEEGTFVGEPWFGPTAASASLLAEDETVERDRDPVSILRREMPKTEPLPPPEPPAVETLAAELQAAETASPETLAPETPEPVTDAAPPEAAEAAPPAAAEDEPLPGLEEALNAELPEPEVPVPASVSVPFADDDADDLPSPGAVAGIAQSPARDPVPARSAVATPVPEPEPEEAPFAHVTDTSAFPEDDIPSTPSARKPLINDLDDDIPAAPSSAAMVAFASRRAAAADSVPRPMDGVTRTSGSAPVGKVAPVARPLPGKGPAGLVTAPTIPGTRGKPKLKGGEIPRPATGPGPTTVRSPARPGGTFGAVAPAKKRTGTVFLVMVGLLLLFLALVAAWASYFMSNGTPVAEQASATEEVVPGVDDEMLADMQDPEGMTDPIPEADGVLAADPGELATETLPVNIGGEETADATAAPDAAAEAVTDTAAPSEDALAAAPEAAPEAAAEAVLEATPEAAPPESAPEETVAEVAEPAPDTAIATDVTAGASPVEDQDEIFLSAMDAPPPALDALALPPLTDVADALPDPVMPPPAPGTVYRFDANGLLQPTPDGIMSPDGVFLIAGKPPILPPTRSEVATAAALAAAAVAAPPAADPATALPEGQGPTVSAADASLVTGGAEPVPETAVPEADPALAGFRPRPRPESLAPATADDDAALAADTASDFAGLRPLPRPASVTTAAAAVTVAASAPADTAALGAQGASLTAQAEAKLAEAAALEAQNPSVVAISMRPASRPRDFSAAVEAAVAAAVREPAPEAEVEVAAAAPDVKPEEVDELDEPETASAAPSIPTKASVAKQATYANAINLSKINLIGTYGTDSRRYALVRQSNGKYKKVTVGDKIDGGVVKAITETEVRYQKGGRLISLKMPKA